MFQLKDYIKVGTVNVNKLYLNNNIIWTSKPPTLGVQQLFSNFNNSGAYVYRTLGYQISAVLRGFSDPITNGTNTEQTIFYNTLSALDFWSTTLDGTVVSEEPTYPTLYDGSTSQPNPLSGTPNQGMLLSVKFYNANDGYLGFAGISYQRVYAFETHTLIPYQGHLKINSYYTASTLNPTPLGKTENYYMILHEIAHTLGVGNQWHSYNGNTLYRSFIVGAGDTTPNPLNLGLSANFFYSTYNDGTRTTSNLGKGTVLNGTTYYLGDANYTNAFDGYHTPLVNAPTYGFAVSAYNEAFGTSLTAIPVENGKGIGSLGAHWEEGENSDSSYGTDNRSYYGNLTPGAPGLNDELMTPQSEGNGKDVYVSKITLGALRDLGYTVNYNKAEVFKPLNYVLSYNGINTEPIKIAFYQAQGDKTNPNYVSGQTLTTTGKTIYLRRGLRYSFFTNYASAIKLTLDSSGNNIITEGVTTNLNTGMIYYNVPTTLTYGTTIWLFASEPNAKAMIIIR